MKAIIVDDEIKARRVLEAMLVENCPQIEIVGLAPDVPEAVKLINKLKPDLVFLDIEMPIYGGFQLLDFFEKIDFQIIFITAHNHYALDAFKVSATDYLLKPVDIEQLVKAVEKAQKQAGSSQVSLSISTLKENIKEENGNIKRIALPVANGLLFADVEDLLYLQADSSYTLIFTVQGQRHLVSKNLKEFEKILPPNIFLRIHRSYIINVNKIKEYHKQDGGYVKMMNDETIFISKDRKEDFLELINNFNF